MKQKSEELVTIYNGEDLKYFTFPQKFDHHQSGVPGNPCYNFRFRIFVFFSYIVLTQLFQLFCTPSEKVKGIWDLGHVITTPINNLYKEHRWQALQLFQDFHIDAITISTHIRCVLSLHFIILGFIPEKFQIICCFNNLLCYKSYPFKPCKT